MRGSVVGFLLVAAVACGGSDSGVTNPPPGKKALDPFLTVRIRNLLDTATAAGRAQWHVYALLTGPYTAQNGIALQGTLSLGDARLNHVTICTFITADSIGQRLLSLVAIGDTLNGGVTPDAQAAALIAAWYAGNVTLPTGWMALFSPPTDVWDSQQFRDGHGLTSTDPIKWGWDWAGAGSAILHERPYADTDGCNS